MIRLYGVEDVLVHDKAVKDAVRLETRSVLPNQEYFADGMTDTLITDLARIHDLRVVSRTSVMRDKGSKKSLQQIASDLNVDAAVEGSIVRSGDRVRITAQLIDTRDDRHLWAQSYEEQISDVLTLQDQVAQEIASQIKLALGQRYAGKATRPINPAAYDAYVRGLYFFNRREVQKSEGYFKQAISIDPTFAAAYAGLASALHFEGVLEVSPSDTDGPALAAAQQAIALDPESGEAYSALGFIEIRERKWTVAEHDLKKAVTLSPSYSLAEIGFAIYLDCVNRPEESVVHTRRAVTLDPLSFYANRHLGAALYFARHYDESLLYLNRAFEIDPDRSDFVRPWSSRDYEMKGNFGEAMRLDPLSIDASHWHGTAPLRAAYRRGDWKTYQTERLKLYLENKQSSCDLYEAGETYLRLGDPGKALQYISQAQDQRCFWADAIQVDPVLDSLRDHPEYPHLLQNTHMSN